MPVDQALRAYMQDSITVEPYASENVNTEESVGAAVAYTCRCEGRRKMVRTPNGEQAVSMVQAYLDRLVSIDPRSRVTLPARFSPLQPPILAVEMLPDETGTGTMAHTVVYC
jgi:hypothetical protein